MDFMQLAQERYSLRKFLKTPVKKEHLDAILKAGHLAPTACNKQPQKIYVLESEAALTKLDGCTKCRFEAPLALLVCADENACWVRRYDGAKSGEVDASIVTTHLMLAAQEQGVGSLWVMAFDPAAVKEAYALPEGITPVAILMLGYPDPAAEPAPLHSTFRDEEEIVSYL